MAKDELTERQRYWLEHLRSWQGSDETLSGYATRHSLNVRLLYDAKAKLTQKGLLPSDEGAPPEFVRGELSEPAASMTVCRVHLPNGLVVELSDVAGGEAWREVLEAASRVR